MSTHSKIDIFAFTMERGNFCQFPCLPLLHKSATKLNKNLKLGQGLYFTSLLGQKGTVVNRNFSSLNGGSIKIWPRVPEKHDRRKYQVYFNNHIFLLVRIILL